MISDSSGDYESKLEKIYVDYRVQEIGVTLHEVAATSDAALYRGKVDLNKRTQSPKLSQRNISGVYFLIMMIICCLPIIIPSSKMV